MRDATSASVELKIQITEHDLLNSTCSGAAARVGLEQYPDIPPFGDRRTNDRFGPPRSNWLIPGANGLRVSTAAHRLAPTCYVW